MTSSNLPDPDIFTFDKGLTELIRIHFGVFWARLACAVLVITCIAAIISELACIAHMDCKNVWVWKLVMQGREY